MAESNTTDGGRIVKMEVDYSSTCDEKIPVCKVMGAEGKINEALEVLLSLEKQTRTVSSALASVTVVHVLNFDYILIGCPGSRCFFNGQDPGGDC